MMKTDVEKAKEVDEYVLKYSRLVKDKRGYNALLTLLQTGVLMNDRLGYEDTVVLCKILIHMKFRFEFISGGIMLTDNTKVNYYHTVMYPPKTEVNPEKSYQSKHDHKLSVGKEERDTTRHWANDIIASNNKTE